MKKNQNIRLSQGKSQKKKGTPGFRIANKTSARIMGLRAVVGQNMFITYSCS